MRTVILEMFKRTLESNDIHYQTVFQTAFKDRVPAVFKNVPTFTEKEHLPDMVKFHFLNEAGGEVNFFFFLTIFSVFVFFFF